MLAAVNRVNVSGNTCDKDHFFFFFFFIFFFFLEDNQTWVSSIRAIVACCLSRLIESRPPKNLKKTSNFTGSRQLLSLEVLPIKHG